MHIRFKDLFIFSLINLFIFMFVIFNSNDVDEFYKTNISENAKLIQIYQEDKGFSEYELDVLKKILDKDNANLFTFYPGVQLGQGVYLNDMEFILDDSDKQLVSNVKDGQIIVLENSILDKYRSELNLDNPDYLENIEIFDTYNKNFQLYKNDAEYIYNFFDMPYFYGEYIIDSKNDATAYEIVEVFQQFGYSASVNEYGNGGTKDNFLNFLDKIDRFTYYKTNEKFILMLIFVFVNSFIIINNLINRLNKINRTKKELTSDLSTNLNYAEQLDYILKSLVYVILISNVIAGAVMYLFFNVSNLIYFILSGCGIDLLMIIITFTIKFYLTKSSKGVA